MVNVSSLAATLRSAPLGPYVASKVALCALSEVLAQEVAALGIRVGVVQPGFVTTSIHERGMVGHSSHPEYKHLTKRLGRLMDRSLRDERPTLADGRRRYIVTFVEPADPARRITVGRDAAILDHLRSRHDADWSERWAASDDHTWKEAFVEYLGPWDGR